MLTCQRLRRAVLLSAALFLMGLILEIIAPWFSSPVLVMALSLVSSLAAVGVLGITLFTAMLPGEALRLSECRK